MNVSVSSVPGYNAFARTTRGKAPAGRELGRDTLFYMMDGWMHGRPRNTWLEPQVNQLTEQVMVSGCGHINNSLWPVAEF